MTESMKKLDTAYQRLMTIPVAGVFVEPMAVAMALIREVYAEMSKPEEGETDGQDH